MVNLRLLFSLYGLASIIVDLLAYMYFLPTSELHGIVEVIKAYLEYAVGLNFALICVNETLDGVIQTG